MIKPMLKKQHHKKQHNHVRYQTKLNQNHDHKHKKQSNISLKTNYDCCRVVPYGPKYFFFFSKLNGKASFQIKKDKPEIKDYISIPNIIYDASLSEYDGTLCQGTIVQLSNNIKMICLENVITFMGNSMKEHTWKQKYNIMLRIVSLISKEQQYTYVKIYKQHQKYVFTLPITMKKDTDIHAYLKENTLPYKVYSIEYLNKTFNKHDKLSNTHEKQNITNMVNSNMNTNTNMITHTHNHKYKIFTIQAEEKQDIYKLYNSEYEGYAHIPSYKTSVMMNKLFRNIKENDNLDALEESDDEEEFENVSSSKYVNLDILYKFRCEWNPRFKLWEPIEQVV